MKALLLTIILLINIPNSVFLAKRGLIGRQERIEKIQDVNIKGTKGEDLYLAHKTSALFLFLGVYFKDEGYVLGIKKSYGSYYPLTQKQIVSFQDKGFLSNPLPKYEIPFFDYLIGYSLWIFLVFIIVTQLLKYRFKKQANSK